MDAPDYDPHEITPDLTISFSDKDLEDMEWRPTVVDALANVLGRACEAVAPILEAGDYRPEGQQRACDVPHVRGERLPVDRALEGHELTQLLSSCQHDRQLVLGARDAAAIGLLYGLGPRSSEASNLDLGDYAPQAGTVRVLGKGNKQREMPCPEVIAQVLQAWIAIRGPWSGPLLTPVWKYDHHVDRAASGPPLDQRDSAEPPRAGGGVPLHPA